MPGFRLRTACVLAERAPTLFSRAAPLLWCRYRVVKSLSADPENGRFALFAHFDRDNRVDDYVIHHVIRLDRAGAVVIFVTTSRLSAGELGRIAPLCAAVIERENIGVDFGSWRTALLVYPRLMQSRLLLFANDSVYGPIHPLETVLRRMEESACDFFAITESLEIKPHYQSYFLGFKSSCLRSAPFRSFLRDIDLLNSRHKVIRRYEIELKAALEGGGLRGRALVPAQGGSTDNPMLSDWRGVLNRGGPYLKVQLLRDNPRRVVIDDWPRAVRSRGYDRELIARHLRRVSEQAAEPPARRRRLFAPA